MLRNLWIVVGSLLTVLLVLAGCDAVESEQPLVEPGLEITEAPNGAVVTNLSGLGPIQEFYFRRDTSGGEKALSQSRAVTEQASDYACYLSVYRPDGEGGAGYYYRSIYLHFPRQIVDEADGKMGVFRHEWHDEAVDHPSKVAVLAHCRLPQTQHAAELLADRLGLTLKQVPSQKAAHAAPPTEALRVGETGTEEAATADGPLHTPLPRVLDGSIPNNNGYTCASGADWMTYEQEYCTDGSDIYLPEVPVEDEAPGPPGGSSGGGGGSDPTWPGGGSDGPLPEPAPRIGPEEEGIPTEIAKKEDLQAIFEECGVTSSSTQDKAFENSIRRAMGMSYQAETPTTDELDGYLMGDAWGHPVIERILEAKFYHNTRWPVVSYSQAKKHIDALSQLYNYAPANGVAVWAPVYYVVSLYTGDNERLDHDGKLVPYAEEHGVVIMHLKVREAAGDWFYLWGRVVTDVQLLRYRDFSISVPDELTNGSTMWAPFKFDCNTD